MKTTRSIDEFTKAEIRELGLPRIRGKKKENRIKLKLRSIYEKISNL